MGPPLCPDWGSGANTWAPMRNLRKAEIRGSGIARWAIRRSIRVGARRRDILELR